MKINPNERSIEDELLSLRNKTMKIHKSFKLMLEQLNRNVGFETDRERRNRFLKKSKLSELLSILEKFEAAIEQLE